MSSKNRKLQFSLAINEALHQMMASDESVFLMGQGVMSPWYVGNTARDLIETFGPERVIDTPVSENAITGAAVGAAVVGMRPVVVHPRMDFMMYALDPIINEAANWHYMSGGRSSAPVVIWGIINRGGEQAAQHSQALQSIFSHIPGLKVVMPATPYDAKGLMISAIKDENPVVYIDDRWLYEIEGEVPEEMYEVPIGRAIIRRKGDDVTLVATSYMVHKAMEAAAELAKNGINAEVLDVRTIKPLDKDLLLKSVKKTGRLVVVDGSWKTCGVSAEISTIVSEEAFDYIKSPPIRVALPDVPAPASRTLEDAYYTKAQDIIDAVQKVIGVRISKKLKVVPLSNPDITSQEVKEVVKVLRSTDLSFGPKVEEFEREGAKFAGRKYGVAVNSGTSGLHLMIKSLDISEGDKVITTPFSFVASANCMLYEKAVPVFVDIDERTLNFSTEKIEGILKKDKKKKIKAILAVDIFGHPAEWDALYDISKKYNLKLIEDSAEAVGSEYCSPEDLPRRKWEKYKKAGSFGDVSVFAFYPNKQVTTGEGGLILTDNKKIYNLCKSLRNQGRGDGSGWLNHFRLGYNYRLSDINCALGVAQLKRIDEILKKRDYVANQYTQRLKSIDGIRPPFCAPNVKIGWFVYVIQLGKEFSRKDRDVIIRKLRKREIEVSNYFSPIHLEPLYRKRFGYKRGDFPVTEHVADRTIALPFYNNLKEAKIEFVVDNLKEIIGKI